MSDPESLPDGSAAIAALTRVQLTAATAESLTGGLVAASLTSVAGSSAVFRGGVVSYDLAAKQHLLGVPAELLQAAGPVDARVATWMARGACRALGADIAVSTTGVAGPHTHGGREPGTVFLGWSAADRHGSVAARLAGSRTQIRGVTTRIALAMLTDCAGNGCVEAGRLTIGNQDPGTPVVLSDPGVTLEEPD